MAEAQLTNQLTRIDSMTNVELRAELKKRGCPTSGNKKDLLAKLRVALQKEYEQTSLETASTTSTMDSMSFDGRINNQPGLQQSPVIPFDVNRSLLNNSNASSGGYITPHGGGSPMTYAQHGHGGEVPLTYNNLQIHDQAAGQYSSVYNLTMHQNIQQTSMPTIPVPQQLTVTPERNQLYDPTKTPNSQQQMTPMSTRRGRTSLDAPANVSVPPIVPMPSPEKRTRGRAKKSSVDSQPYEIQETIQQIQQQQPELTMPPTNPVVETLPDQLIDTTPVEQPIIEESMVHNSSTNANSDNNIEVNPFVSKSNEEDQKEIGEEREGRGDSRSPSVGSSSAKSESVIKEIPLSGDRHRLSRSKSPKSRWHHSPSPRDSEQQINQISVIDEENSSASKTTNGDEKISDEQIEKSSIGVSSAEEKTDTTHNNKEKIEPTPVESEELPPKEESKIIDIQPPEKAASHQQLKSIRSQGSSSTTTATTSSSLMKGLNRSTTNRMNLSSDILKTLIPDISLAPESVIDTELEASVSEQNDDDQMASSPNQTVLETSVGSGLLLNDPMTMGELAEQKQQRNRTVVIDLAVDSSSLNDDLIGNGVETKRKAAAVTAPTRIASFESKALIDGKTNALMMDEPVRVKDVTVAREPPSQIVFIRGLTRPFTLTQLKELLGRYGTLTDGEFWLDKIKSQCFVMYNTLEEAQNAREGLDGCRWPSTNPKTLFVRFGRQEEFEFSKSHDLPPDQMPTDSSNPTDDRVAQEKQTINNKSGTAPRRSQSPVDETRNNNKRSRPAATGEVREWDLPKLQQEKETIGNERQVIEEAPVKNNEPPAKGLDDYFRKTKAKPAIYWLPLTDDQIVERTRKKDQRRKADQNTRESNTSKDPKPRSNNNGNSSSYPSHRRSPSPKDKRKRAASSSSPPRRDNKRH